MSAQRFEIFTSKGKRREWPSEVMALIVAEFYTSFEHYRLAFACTYGLEYVLKSRLSSGLIRSKGTCSHLPALAPSQIS